MPLIKKRVKRLTIIEEFQNKGPAYAIIQLSKFNIFKTSSVWIALFLAITIFAFFVGRIFEGDVNYNISQLDAAISLWGFLAFALTFWFISYTKRYDYALSLVNYIHTFVLIIGFVMTYLFYKLGIFGTIDNSNLTPSIAIQAIRTLFYLWATFYLLIIISWYITTWLSRRKYKYALVKASFLLLPIILYLTTPFYIGTFNGNFIVEKKPAFFVATLVFFFGFVLTIAFLSKYQTIGQTNLKIVNKVFGAELSHATFGALVGTFLYQSYWTAPSLKFSQYAIISLVISLIIVSFFVALYLFWKKQKTNTFLNKVIIKSFTIITLIVTIALVYIASNDSKDNAFASSIVITLPLISSLFIIFFLASTVIKLVVFERWPMVTKIANFIVAFLFIFTQALIATLEDGKILYDWLGHFLIIIVLALYTLIEILALFPELFVVLMAVKNKEKQVSNLKIQKEG